MRTSECFKAFLCDVHILVCLTNRSSVQQCGVPKKGHVCPYQPKLTRRPGEPLPEMRSAAIQVEMDEVSTTIGSV
jgi:hypothetical protein